MVSNLRYGCPPLQKFRASGPAGSFSGSTTELSLSLRDSARENPRLFPIRVIFKIHYRAVYNMHNPKTESPKVQTITHKLGRDEP